MSETAKKNAKASAPAPTAWEIVQLARDPARPTARQYAEGMCDEFIELHGDRLCADDPAILGGLGRIGKSHEIVDNESVRGMIFKVKHLIEVEEL